MKVNAEHSQKEGNKNKQENEKPKQELKGEKLFLTICIFVAVFLMLLTAALTQSNLLLTFLGFLPLLLTIFVFIWAVEQRIKRNLFLAVPLVMALVFMGVLGIINMFIENALNIGGVTVVNLFLGLIVAFVLMFEKEKRKTHTHIEKKTIFQHVALIEDKCKALNSVIGRVYKVANGGSEELRNKIKIPSELYNKFYSLKEEGIKHHKNEAKNILEEILHSLKKLENREKIVFTTTEIKRLKNLVRDERGEDPIINVLLMNDKDPVDEYYLGTIQTIEAILKSL